MPPPVIIPVKQETKPPKPKLPTNLNPPPNQTLPTENQTSNQTRRDAFKIMLERRKTSQNQDSKSPKPRAKTKPTSIGKKKPNQN